MGYVIGAAANRAAVPGVDEIENERRVDADGRMQTFGRLPRAETDAGDELACRSCRMQRDGLAIASYDIARIDQTARLDLEAIKR